MAVSSMPLKGPMRERQVPQTLWLGSEMIGCIHLKEVYTHGLKSVPLLPCLIGEQWYPSFSAMSEGKTFLGINQADGGLGTD